MPVFVIDLDPIMGRGRDRSDRALRHECLCDPHSAFIDGHGSDKSCFANQQANWMDSTSSVVPFLQVDNGMSEIIATVIPCSFRAAGYFPNRFFGEQSQRSAHKVVLARRT